MARLSKCPPGNDNFAIEAATDRSAGGTFRRAISAKAKGWGTVRTGDAFPSTYLKAEDLQGRRATVTISKIEMERIGDDHKPVMYFVGKDKALVLNRTNAGMIQDLLGTDEMDQWRGRAIILYATKTEFQGKRVPCIRVEERLPAQVKMPSSPEPPAEFHAADDDVPF
jgi:hypothetical protein